MLVLLLALAQLLAVASVEGLDEGERPGSERGLRAGERLAWHLGWVRPGSVEFRMELLQNWRPSPNCWNLRGGSGWAVPLRS